MNHQQKQRELNIHLIPLEGEPKWQFKARSRDFRKPVSHSPPEKLFADLLKRESRRAMADVNDCPPDTIPAHLARVQSLLSIVEHVMRHDFESSPEARPSGKQLLYACTLHDYAVCLRLTLKTHREPAFVNRHEAAFGEIIHRLDLLAGLIANSPDVLEMLLGRNAEREVES